MSKLVRCQVRILCYFLYSFKSFYSKLKKKHQSISNCSERGLLVVVVFLQIQMVDSTLYSLAHANPLLWWLWCQIGLITCFSFQTYSKCIYFHLNKSIKMCIVVLVYICSNLQQLYCMSLFSVSNVSKIITQSLTVTVASYSIA